MQLGNGQRVFDVRIAILIAAGCCAVAAAETGIVDRLTFGDDKSEGAHAVEADASDVVPGLLGVRARRLLPPTVENWEGGRVRFRLKVDPDRVNYVTARFSGSDVSPSRMILFVGGKQVGYRHLGDVDILDFGSEDNGGGYPGRFYYVTSPLPLASTKGKTEIDFEIRSTGQIWGYGDTFIKLQKPMTNPTRGLYAIASHTDPYYAPAFDEKQGFPPADPPRRPSPGPEILDVIKARVNGVVGNLLLSKQPLSQLEMRLLARAYQVDWTVAYKNPATVEKLVEAFDALYAAYQRNPAIAQSDPAVYNGGWFGLGLMGDALRIVGPTLQDKLNESIPGTNVSRRVGWTKMLVDSRDWHRTHRRLYTNQTMINDLNVYRANRGIAAIDLSSAMPEPAVRRYLYESLGLEPWRDSDNVPGITSEKWHVGDNYYELTAKGLTKELGYVGYYGEVIDWATQIYDATRDPGQEGDPKIKKQIQKIADARAVFRYPAVDADGNRAMRIETICGWRDMHYPGDVVYGERPSWDATALYAADALMDDTSIGYAKQMLDDNQFFSSLARQGQEKSLRATAGLLGALDQYAAVKAAATANGLPKLPMTLGQPDFVFSDEEDGVVAVKNGPDTLYISLYWRARYAVNYLARVHYMTAQTDHIATVTEHTEFTPSGLTFERPDWINFGFGGGGPKYPGDLHSASAGEMLPIAKAPDCIKFKPGDENVYAGRGDYYELHYDPYLISMNTTTDRTFSMKVPKNLKLTNLTDRKTAVTADTIPLKPRSTVVLYASPPNRPASDCHVH